MIANISGRLGCWFCLAAKKLEIFSWSKIQYDHLNLLHKRNSLEKNTDYYNNAMFERLLYNETTKRFVVHILY